MILKGVGTKATRCPGRWAAPIFPAWLICASVVSWRIGREIMDSGGTFFAGFYVVRTSTEVLLVVAGGLSVALGVAVAMERLTLWILAAVPTATFFATLTNSVAESDSGLDSS